jgi:hypothetical protein
MEFVRKCYRILDVPLALTSDSPELLTVFQRDYSRFEIPCTQTTGSPTLNVAWTNQGGWGGELKINDTVFTYGDLPFPEELITRRILRSVYDEIRQFILLHAGVVAKEGGALIIAGPPGCGKTTQVLTLLNRDFALFSDDVCPIHRRTGEVHPFPRSVWIRPETQVVKKGASEMRGGKTFLSPSALKGCVAHEPLRPKGLICIDPGEGDDGVGLIELFPKEVGEDVLSVALGRLRAVAITKQDGDWVTWRIQYPKGRGLSADIKTILDRYADVIWEVIRVDRMTPDFTRESELIPMTGHEAAFFLMRELKQAPLAEGETTTRNQSASGFFMKLIDLFQDIPCWRLRTGTLDSMQDLAMRAFFER